MEWQREGGRPVRGDNGSGQWSNNRIVNSAVITVRGGVRPRPVVVISLVMAVANLHKFTPNDVTHTRSAHERNIRKCWILGRC